MSHPAAAFLEKLASDPAFGEAFVNAFGDQETTSAEIAEYARKVGYEVSEDELVDQLRSRIASGDTEGAVLSESELSSVSGGVIDLWANFTLVPRAILGLLSGSRSSRGPGPEILDSIANPRGVGGSKGSEFTA